MIPYLYTLWNDHNSKSGNPWSPHIVFLQWELLRFTFLSNFQICNTLLLTIVTMLYITSPWLIYNWKLFPFNSLHPFQPLSPSLAITNLFIMSTSLDCFALFCFDFFFNSTYKWNHTVFIILISLFHLAYALKAHPCCCTWHDSILFHGKVVIHVYTYIYPCIYIHTYHTASSLSVHLLMDT